MNTATAVKATTAGTVKLTIRQWANEDRPSVKLQMYGVKSLSDAELLAILIGSFTHDDAYVNTNLCQSSHADALSLYKSVVIVHQQDVEMLRFQIHHLRQNWQSLPHILLFRD